MVVNVVLNECSVIFSSGPFERLPSEAFVFIVSDDLGRTAGQQGKQQGSEEQWLHKGTSTRWTNGSNTRHILGYRRSNRNAGSPAKDGLQAR
jgi:hypothetical protein